MKFVSKPVTKGIFFSEVCRYTFPQIFKSHTSAHVIGVGIQPVFKMIRTWKQLFDEWGDVDYSVIGPVELINPLIHARGQLTFAHDKLAFIMVNGNDNSVAKVRIGTAFLDMIVVTLGNEWNAEALNITFHIQIGPPEYLEGDIE